MWQIKFSLWEDHLLDDNDTLYETSSNIYPYSILVKLVKLVKLIEIFKFLEKIAVNWKMAVINVITRSFNGSCRHYACDFARRSQRGGILITALFEERWRSGESVAIERFHVVEINRAIHRLMGLSDRERWRIWWKEHCFWSHDQPRRGSACLSWTRTIGYTNTIRCWNTPSWTFHSCAFDSNVELIFTSMIIFMSNLYLYFLLIIIY